MELSGHDPMVRKGPSVKVFKVIIRVIFKRLG